MCSLAGRYAFMGTCMDKRVMQDEIFTPWQSRKKREIGHIAAAKIEHVLGIEKRSGFLFQCLVFGVIAT